MWKGVVTLSARNKRENVFPLGGNMSSRGREQAAQLLQKGDVFRIELQARRSVRPICLAPTSRGWSIPAVRFPHRRRSISKDHIPFGQRRTSTITRKERRDDRYSEEHALLVGVLMRADHRNRIEAIGSQSTQTSFASAPQAQRTRRERPPTQPRGESLQHDLDVLHLDVQAHFHAG